jgi:hypothetical protein
MYGGQQQNRNHATDVHAGVVKGGRVLRSACSLGSVEAGARTAGSLRVVRVLLRAAAACVLAVMWYACVRGDELWACAVRQGCGTEVTRRKLLDETTEVFRSIFVGSVGAMLAGGRVG